MEKVTSASDVGIAIVSKVSGTEGSSHELGDNGILIGDVGISVDRSRGQN